MTEKQTVVFIFYDSKERSVLVEKRLPNSELPNSILYPGGKINETDEENIVQTLKREIKEELGVVPLEYHYLSGPKIISETNRRLKPFLITRWAGQIPDKILDKGNSVFWEDIEVIAKSELRSMRETTMALKNFLSETVRL
jgi:8-oxo-dGTP pyrophosphatase MutT (NUDIX family)